MSMSPVHLQCDAVSTFLLKVKALRSIVFFHIWSTLYTVFSTDSPTPLLKNPHPRGNAWNACFFCFACPMLRIVFRMRKIGTGSSGRVTQVFALSPATRPVPYLAKDIPHIAE